MKFIPHVRLSSLLIGHNMSLIMPYEIFGARYAVNILTQYYQCSQLQWGFRKIKRISSNTINIFELRVLLHYYFNSAWENTI